MQMWKPCVALVAAIIVSAPAVADDPDLTEFDAIRDELNAAFAAQNVDKIKTMMTPDHVAATTYYGGPLDTPTELEAVLKFNVDEAEFTPSKVSLLAPTVALVTYENTYVGTFDGEPLPPKVFVSEIWVQQDGTWLQRLYQETPIPAE
ncbi:nuclear transport factor 2 family protein [Bauldia sp.]|uniref:nuclear transport factor 2 family protein n=1 Tax=Bauldia sp. TaxID=2575872 RepID=UPI003BABBC86